MPCMAVVLTLALTDFDFGAEGLHGFLYFIVRGMSIDIHGRFNILVTHDCLYYLYIAFVLAKPGTECVPEDMRRKVWNQFWFPIIFLCSIRFLAVVGIYNSCDDGI